MTDLTHPIEFTNGTRVLRLVSRKKDTGENKIHVQFVTYNSDEFVEKKALLKLIRQPNQRIYASASSLCPIKARRKFRELQLQSEYDQDPGDFYRNLETRWISCLLKSEDEKHWLFDCDTYLETLITKNDLERIGQHFYEYNSKSGTHFITEPFNSFELRSDVTHCLHKNPLMLWSY